MQSNLPKHRKSPRLRGFNYRQQGAYFITICTSNRANIFGSIVNEVMQLSLIGETAATCWSQIAEHFSYVDLDVFVVMPNHVHGILYLNDRQLADLETVNPADSTDNQGNRPKGAPARSIGSIVASYKAAVSRIANKSIVNTPRPLWQERYYDHIVRNEEDLNRIRAYILTNPARWENDSLYCENAWLP